MKKTAVVKIESLGDKGVGVGRLDGKVFFARFAAPGDLAEVEVTEEKRGWARGRILRLLEPSENRVEPRCSHFGSCGGCAWQHLDHATEIAGKAASLAGFFKSRLKLPDEAFLPPLQSPCDYGYRNRLTLHVERGISGPSIGMSGYKSHRLIEIACCPVATPAVNKALACLRDGAKSGVPFPTPSRVLLQEDALGGLWCSISSERPLGGADETRLKAWAKGSGFAGVWSWNACAPGKPIFGEAGETMPFAVTAAGKSFRIGVPVGAFTQANPHISQALVDILVDHRALFEGKAACDFYCGSGNFTLPLALFSARVTGIEGYAEAARAASANCEKAGLGNATIVGRPVETGLGEEAKRADFWLLDPPRTGSLFLAEASKHGPPAILYISCDPPSMARDLGMMLENGYEAAWVRGADMFPRTAHLEVAALLTRRF